MCIDAEAANCMMSRVWRAAALSSGYNEDVKLTFLAYIYLLAAKRNWRDAIASP